MPRKTSNTAEVGTPSMSFMGREIKEGSRITENSAVTALGFTKVSFLQPLVLSSLLSKLVR